MPSVTTHRKIIRKDHSHRRSRFPNGFGPIVRSLEGFRDGDLERVACLTFQARFYTQQQPQVRDLKEGVLRRGQRPRKPTINKETREKGKSERSTQAPQSWAVDSRWWPGKLCSASALEKDLEDGEEPGDNVAVVTLEQAKASEALTCHPGLGLLLARSRGPDETSRGVGLRPLG